MIKLKNNTKDIQTQNKISISRKHGKLPITHILVFMILLIFDIINLKFGLINIHDVLKDYLNPSSLISQTFLTITVTILTILFAVYFIVIQLFRSRYPLDFIDRYVKNNLLVIAYDYISNIFFGLLLIFLTLDLQITKLFYLYHIVFCLISFVKLYKNYRIFNPQEVINSYKSKIINCINCNEVQKNQIDIYLNELDNYSEESFKKMN